MARGTQHRKRRPAQNARAQAVAAAPRKQKPPQWQEELFFQRLRVHAKWAFVFLALVFAFGFVFFGVGSGSTGISGALQNAFNFGNMGGGGTSISKLQHKVDKHPQDAKSWRDLATALEQKQRTPEAVNALERYTALRPKDQSALAELAAEYGALATKYSSDYTAAQQEATSQAPPAAVFAPPGTTPLGKAFSDPTALQDPISAAVSSLAQNTASTAYSGYQAALRNSEAAYKRLAALNPSDATTQLQLAQAAQTAHDSTTEIAALERFLKLAPTDPEAKQVKKALKALKAQAAAAAKTSTHG